MARPLLGAFRLSWTLDPSLAVPLSTLEAGAPLLSLIVPTPGWSSVAHAPPVAALTLDPPQLGVGGRCPERKFGQGQGRTPDAALPRRVSTVWGNGRTFLSPVGIGHREVGCWSPSGAPAGILVPTLLRRGSSASCAPPTSRPLLDAFRLSRAPGPSLTVPHSTLEAGAPLLTLPVPMPG